MSNKVKLVLADNPADVDKKYRTTRILWGFSVRRPNGSIVFVGPTGKANSKEEARDEALGAAKELNWSVI